MASDELGGSGTETLARTVCLLLADDNNTIGYRKDICKS
jgi:hypothetical protein